MEKRILSLMTSLVMVVSLIGILPAVTAGAEESYSELVLGENTITTSNDEAMNYYSFTPETSGVYYFECDYDVDIYLSEYSDFGFSWGRQYDLEAGDEYSFYFIEYGIESTCDVYFYEAEYEYLGQLSLGDSKVKVNDDNVSVRSYYSFKPTQSKNYRIKSNNPDSDPMVLITDSEHNVISRFDDDNEWNYDSITYLESNETYYFSFFDYQDASETNFNISQTYTYNNYEYIVLDNGTVEIISYNGSASIINIPSSIDGKAVTSIGKEAFYYCYNLTSVTIPNSVTSIGNSAFEDCYSLSSVAIPNSVTSIGNYAFGWCESLASVTIGNSVTSIGYNAFSGCKSLMSVTIPNSVTSIGYDAFAYCDNLKSVTMGNSVKSIGEYAFSYCSNLQSITIPKSVTEIGEKAFGYYYDWDNGEYIKVSNFKISCYAGTAGEKYAKDNGFAYQLLSDIKPTTNQTPNPSTNAKKSPTIKTTQTTTNTTVAKPAKVTKVKLTAKKKKLNVSWKKVSGATGYEVKLATNKKFTKGKKTVTVKKNKVTIKKLKSKKKYFVKVRAYNTVNGKTYYGKWSKVVKKKAK